MCQLTSCPLDGKSPPVQKVTNDEYLNRNDGKNCSASAASSTLHLAQETLDRGTLLACLSLLLLITGMSITFPQMQSRRDELGCNSLCYGTITSARSALSLVGTAVVGRLSDRNGSFLARTIGSLGKGRKSAIIGVNANASGRRACLYLGTIASLLGLALAVSMNSPRGLWLSMIPGALLQHNFEVYKALLSEYHNDIEHLGKRIKDNNAEENMANDSDVALVSNRSGSVGKLGMSVGVSFMIGPMIAALASPTFQIASYFAILCTLASGLLVAIVPLPIGCASEHECGSVHGKNNPENGKTEFSLMNMLKLKTSKSRAAMFFLVIRLNMALAFHIFNTIWPASLKKRFKFGPSDHARFMSFIGLTYAFSQGFMAKRIVQIWGKEGKVHVIVLCCAVLGTGRYIAYNTESLIVIYTAFLFIINALGTMNTIITADTGAMAPSNEVGGLFGILEASQSAAGMVGPFLGGLISHYLGEDAPLIAVVGVYGFLFTFISWGYERFVLSSSNEEEGKKLI
eukprot:CAMPEP_0172555524 /NCGR_PEP_ID=MMETSP1067-20121228/58461_1 /TAXON_ID=265564 ORGANISM="Thalassiosira punctigera, Strain Tpunct2005C2" /NCGR_SAMPLE_ID=MMETSP1067 /ASSEMBLY_ACC=CAM_ASM_000444 /LENGTH=514 /DNA_ID=CAMNT_0013344049 /DNA_START=122 /DNA_END=1666 /DNA_ORIENTATION=-